MLLIVVFDLVFGTSVAESDDLLLSPSSSSNPVGFDTLFPFFALPTISSSPIYPIIQRAKMGEDSAPVWAAGADARDSSPPPRR